MKFGVWTTKTCALYNNLGQSLKLTAELSEKVNLTNVKTEGQQLYAIFKHCMNNLVLPMNF